MLWGSFKDYELLGPHVIALGVHVYVYVSVESPAAGQISCMKIWTLWKTFGWLVASVWNYLKYSKVLLERPMLNRFQ